MLRPIGETKCFSWQHLRFLTFFMTACVSSLLGWDGAILGETFIPHRIVYNANPTNLLHLRITPTHCQHVQICSLINYCGVIETRKIN
jgi:hypothetical protein